MTNIVKADTKTIRGLMASDIVKSKFTEILGKNGPSFMSAVTTLATTTKLSECEPKSILSAAIAAASLDLQVTPSLGFAALVPYNSKNGKVAQFQVMSKGLIQLALRSGQFRSINVTEIYEGEFGFENRLTGEINLSGERKSDKIIGYAAYFELLNGFCKSLYMTVDKVREHGKRYSKTYTSPASPWVTNFDAMAKKTVLKLLLSRYAPLSIQMQSAISRDQSVLKTDENLEIGEILYEDYGEVATSELDEEVTATRRTQKKEEPQTTENK
jgi:recombination protein RecT